MLRKLQLIKRKKEKPYLIIAQAIGGSKCGTNQLELKAVYWLAYDYAARAKSADPSVAATASKLMSAYKKQWPSKEMLFQFGALDKPKMTIGCWIKRIHRGASGIIVKLSIKHIIASIPVILMAGMFVSCKNDMEEVVALTAEDNGL